jgi:hypothetical protein
MSLHKFLGLASPPSKKQKTVETCREYQAKKKKEVLPIKLALQIHMVRTQNRQNVLQSLSQI